MPDEMMPTTERPAYYRADGLEAIDVIEKLDMGAGFYLGSVLKYLFRLGAKDGNNPLNDLRKARTYLDLYIKYVEQKAQVGAGQDI